MILWNIVFRNIMETIRVLESKVKVQVEVAIDNFNLLVANSFDLLF